MSKSKKMETYYIILENGFDEVIVQEATSHQDALERAGLLEATSHVDDEGAYIVCVFKASDAKRFELDLEVEYSVKVEELK